MGQRLYIQTLFRRHPGAEAKKKKGHGLPSGMVRRRLQSLCGPLAFMKWEVAICKKPLPSLCGPLAFMKLEVCRHLAIYREKSKRPKKKKGGVWRAIKLIKKFSKKSSSFWGLSWGPSGPSWAPSGLSSFPWRNYLNPFQPYWSLVQLYEKPAK